MLDITLSDMHFD